MDFALQVAGPYESVLASALDAHRRGMVALAVPDHYLMSLSRDHAAEAAAPDSFVHLGGLARETSDIELVMLATPGTFRHPAVLAKMAVTIDLMSGGRFRLGVGTGWMDLEHEVFGFPFPPMRERFDILEDALAYLNAAFDPEYPGHTGPYFTLEAFPIAPEPVRRVPIVIGGTGSVKTPRLAGVYGDEFNVYPGPDMEDRIDRMRAAASGAGRDPDEILLSSSGQVIAAATQAEFEDVMEGRASEARISRQELDAYFEARQTPRGTFEQVRAQLDHMEHLGVERFYLQSIFTPGDLDTLVSGLEIG